MLDLTPFGFTPTESAAYEALLELGPSSGYAVAKHLNIARANAYQALDGLERKRAAIASDGTPRSYRAVTPEGLLATVTREESVKLDRLEGQIAQLGNRGEPTLVRFAGERRLEELVLRTAARAPAVRCAASDPLVRRLIPIWRKRARDQTPTELLVVGDPTGEYAVPITARVDRAATGAFGDATPFLLTTPAAAILALEMEGEVAGIWTSEPVIRGVADIALSALASQPGKT